MFETHDAEHFTGQTVFRPNSLCSILNGLKTGSTGAFPELCLPPDRDRPRQAQVYHKSRYSAKGRAKQRLHSSYFTPFVPPFLRSSAA